MKKWFLILFVFFLSLSYVSSTSNETNEISGCGGGILTESYTMPSDLYCDVGYTMGANGITLNCDGHKVMGYGFGVGVNFNGYDDVTLKNCNISNWDYGVFIAGPGDTKNNRVLNNSINYNDINGVRITLNSPSNLISGNLITNNYEGVFISNGVDRTDSNNIINNRIINNVNRGVYIDIGSYNSVYDNIIADNGINAYETVGGTENNWNFTFIGNDWNDFESNPGYPETYIIDGPGDGIDWKPLSMIGDSDLDGVLDDIDNCLGIFNPSQMDFDLDNVGDWCDNCPLTSNPGQRDDDGDYVGNKCENTMYACRAIISAPE